MIPASVMPESSRTCGVLPHTDLLTRVLGTESLDMNANTEKIDDHYELILRVSLCVAYSHPCLSI